MIWDEGIVEFEYPDPDAPKLGWAPNGSVVGMPQPDTTCPIVLSMIEPLKTLRRLRSRLWWNKELMDAFIPDGTPTRPLIPFERVEGMLKRLGTARGYLITPAYDRVSYMLGIEDRPRVSDVCGYAYGALSSLKDLQDFFEKWREDESYFSEVRNGVYYTNEKNDGPKSPDLFDALRSDLERLNQRHPMTVSAGGSSLHVFACEPMVAAIAAIDARPSRLSNMFTDESSLELSRHSPLPQSQTCLGIPGAAGRSVSDDWLVWSTVTICSSADTRRCGHWPSC